MKRAPWSPSYKHWARFTLLPDPWDALRLPEFNCGHLKVPSNTIINRYPEKKIKSGEIVVVQREVKRCRTCHNERSAQYEKRRMAA